ncbi:UPF0349 protein [Paenibacillus sp. J31TS4]|uniref:YuzB family protein n=1 Tax=Paenibacillus sp. J31TS4 TaxID=2807195 RepID=UPI001B1DA42E|nr:YuzB family protein [Paenibacillus sp. J31TS4]GIP40730.1 UPF0349 protein [Paenibacillus sp. J31TS4]
MRPVIEYCTNNGHQDPGCPMKQLESNPAYDVVEYGCLGNCGECYASPYALVNGEPLAAPTEEELYELIRKAIQEIEAIDSPPGE